MNHKENMDFLAENLKQALEKANLSMTDLAKATGITYNMIKRYCSGDAVPSLYYGMKISKALNISLDILVGNKAPNSMFKEVFEEDFTYIAGFMRTVRKFPEKEAMIDPLEEKSWTYKELNQDVNKLSNTLIKDGIGKGDIIMMQLYNCSEFVFSYLAPQKIGAVSSPINFSFSPGETAVCIEDSKPEIYMYDSEIAHVATVALEMSKHKPKVVIMTGEGDLPKGHIRYADYIKEASTNEPDSGYLPYIYDESLRLYTSGTTGKPKGVPIYNANEVLTCHDILMHFPMNPTDTTMNMTPWFHRGGIHSGGPSPTFYCGGRIVIMRNFKAQMSLKYVEKYKITFLIGVPSVIKMLLRSQERYGADLSSLRGIITMGAPFERADCLKVQKLLTPRLFNGYGTTESFWNTFLRPYELPEMSGSAGRACTDDEVRVIKTDCETKGDPEAMVEQDEKEVGEIIIRTPKSSYTYHNNPEEAKNKFYKGWLYTGDLGTWDKNQFITVVGRKDDMIISGGENIYPAMIEEVLNQHPKVASAAITSVPDNLRGEVVVAYIVAEENAPTVGELTKYCMASNMLSTYKRPRYYRFVQELPTTATGKIQHYVVKEIALNEFELGLLKRASSNRQ